MRLAKFWAGLDIGDGDVDGNCNDDGDEYISGCDGDIDGREGDLNINFSEIALCNPRAKDDNKHEQSIMPILVFWS